MSPRSNDVLYPSHSSGVVSGRLIGSSPLWRFCSYLILLALLLSASTGVLLASAPALQVSVTDTRTTAIAGEVLTYTVRVENTGASPLTNVRTRIKLSPNVTFVSASDNPTVLPPGDTYEWMIGTLPAGAGGFAFRYLSFRINNQLAPGTVITTNAEADQVGDPTPNTAIADMTTVEAPSVTLAPSNLLFGDQRVGQPSPPQSVTLTNNGNQPLAITTISVSGPFAQTNACPTPLPIGGQCTINVTFTPTAFGAANGTLSVSDNAAGSPHMATLTGNGTQPAVQLNPTSLSFGSVRVGTPSSPLPVTLTNSGTAPLLITSIAASGDFAQTNTCLITPQPIVVGGSCTINVTFTPTAAGSRNGTIAIFHDAPTSPDTITLTGTGSAPVAVVTPASLNFGNQGVASSSTAQTVTITNTGDAPLAISSIGATGDFAQTNNCASSLAPGNTCQIAVMFTPTVIGSRNGTLSITTDSAGSPHTVALTGNGLAATVQVGPLSIDFGGVQVNQTSVARTVTITNTGNTPLTFNSITPSSNFNLSANTCPTSPATLAPTASCSVGVTFTPTAPGTQNGTLTFIDSALGGPQVVNLAGNGLLAVLSVNPASLTFGDQRMSTSSSAQIITLVNTGNQALTINSRSITSGTDFAFDGATTTCVATTMLQPNGSCTIGVIFTPTATGARSDSLTITDTTPVASHTIPLNGRGTNPQASLSATSLSFGSQQVNTTSVAQTITMTNTGTGALAISSFSSSGNFAQTNTCGSSLAEGASCTISVTFRPTVIGVRTGTLTITDDAAGSPQTVSLTGVGIQPVLSLSPTSLDFGSLAVNTPSASQVVTLTNTGSQPLLLTSIATSSNFSQTNQCPSSLAIGESCTVSVVFTPTEVGPTSGALTITSNAPSSPHTLTMAGIGNGAVFHSVPAPGTIPMSSVIGGSNAISITISNIGNQPLTVTGPSETAQPPFTIVSNSIQQLQQASGDQVIVITCSPTSAGPFTQKLSFTSNDPVTPQAVYTLVCTGTAAATPGYSSSPSPGSAWTIGTTQVGSSASADLFISESGTAALIVGLNGGSAATAITGPNASDFTISAPTNFPVAIAEGGAPQRLTLRCQPSDAGTRTATLTLTTNDPSQPTVSYALSCTGQATAGQYMVYLPTISKAATTTLASQPDLVASLNVSATQIQAGQPVGVSVTITNQGNAAASEFWVDLYINPSSPPSAPNQPWNQRCQLDPCYGIAWYVTQSIAPGESIILTSTAGSYYAANTIWNGTFAPGTSDLYAYVDSWNPTVADGAVTESNETNNLAELHGLTVTGPAVMLNATSSAADLPMRPAHPNQ